MSGHLASDWSTSADDVINGPGPILYPVIIQSKASAPPNSVYTPDAGIKGEL